LLHAKLINNNLHLCGWLCCRRIVTWRYTLRLILHCRVLDTLTLWGLTLYYVISCHSAARTQDNYAVQSIDCCIKVCANVLSKKSRRFIFSTNLLRDRAHLELKVQQPKACLLSLCPGFTSAFNSPLMSICYHYCFVSHELLFVLGLLYLFVTYKWPIREHLLMVFNR